MNTRKHAGFGRPLAIFLAVLLATAFGQAASAQSFEDYTADCGKQARDAGLKGTSMTAFIKKCIAKKQGRDGNGSQGSQSQ